MVVFDAKGWGSVGRGNERLNMMKMELMIVCIIRDGCECERCV